MFDLRHQFITRKITAHKIPDGFEAVITNHYNSGDLINKGLPVVQQIAGALAVSPGYLSSLFKALTGQNAQQHIHEKLI